jgi:hypothetical protein
MVGHHVDAVSAELGAVVVFDELLYKPGGQVHRWMTLLCHHFEEHAKVAAPERSGELRAGIRSHAEPVGAHQMRGTIESNAPHSLYVLRGTGHPVRGRAGSIYSRRVWANGGDPEAAYLERWGYRDPNTGKVSNKRIPGVRRELHRVRKKGFFMRFGPDEYGPKVITPVVSGQEPNNFLFTAWRATARTHPSIRGLAPTASITEF